MSIRLRLTIFVLILLALPSLALAAKSHKVKKNETLSSIARKYHVRVADLKAANNLANTRVKPGTILVVPPVPRPSQRSLRPRSLPTRCAKATP